MKIDIPDSAILAVCNAIYFEAEDWYRQALACGESNNDDYYPAYRNLHDLAEAAKSMLTVSNKYTRADLQEIIDWFEEVDNEYGEPIE